MSRVLSGEQRAWVELVRRYRTAMRRAIRAVLRRHHEFASPAHIEDAYAESLLALVRDDMYKLRMWKPERGGLRGWMLLLAINAAYDYTTCRRHRRVEVHGGARPHSAAPPSPLDALLTRERRGCIADIVAKYSPRDRALLALYFGNGLSADEIASEMKISTTTVYTKKHKLLRRLVEELPVA